MSEEIKEFSFENEEYRQTYWHTCSHIMAQAVKRLWPEVKLAIGPSIKEGWYYDMDAPFAFTPEHMTEIEAEMRKICKEKLKLERFELPREEAIKFMEEKGEPYKVELIQDLPEDAPISFYKQGEFTDLCAGPHLDSTGRVKGNAIKLLACNAAYWRGDSNRETLQRIYGIAFPKKEELDAYLERIEEAKRRDHRKLGKELGLFAFRDEAPGFPFYLPKGMVLKNTLIDYWRQVHKKWNYVAWSTVMSSPARSTACSVSAASLRTTPTSCWPRTRSRMRSSASPACSTRSTLCLACPTRSSCPPCPRTTSALWKSGKRTRKS